LGSKSKPKVPCLAVFGTGSEVGKSIVAAALCRCFSDRGFHMAPFKAQNMSNNSGVTPEGLEMGRAQIVQAEAARRVPHVDMNPILLKPTGETGSQVILLGKTVGTLAARHYYRKKDTLFRKACAALNRLRRCSDGVIIEGAGSCAEINLMAHDIVNFRMARFSGAPVILVADIHKGGVFAQIVGTLDCLTRADRDRIKGILINRFRGDPELFADGVAWIEQKTRKPVLGVLPWWDEIRIEAEDSVVLEQVRSAPRSSLRCPAVAVIRFPHIANFTDFDPLFTIPGLEVYFLDQPRDLAPFKGVILPGSKNTRSDLQWLRTVGWEHSLRAYKAGGGHLLGICGGYQMLGRRVHDVQGLEGPPGKSEGLAFLPVETHLQSPKRTTRTQFSWDNATAVGYEIHMGRTRRKGGHPLFEILSRNQHPCRDEDGCITEDGRIMGTYIHGLFDTPAVTRMWLRHMGLDRLPVPETSGMHFRDRQYTLLAEHFERYIDMSKLKWNPTLHSNRDQG